MWGTIPEWIGLLVTAGAVIAAFITLRKLERQTVASEKAAKSARRSAIAARQAVHSQTELSRTDQRAWVGHVSTKMKYMELGEQACFLVTIKNFGHTPAKMVRVQVSAKPRAYADVWAYSEPDIPVESVVVMQPTEKQEVPVYTKQRMNSARLEDIAAARVLIDIIGRIDYLDIFGASHWTTFHGVYERNSGAVVAAMEGNDCD